MNAKMNATTNATPAAPPTSSTNRPQSRSALSQIALALGLILSTMAAFFAFRAFDADESQRFSEAADEIRTDLQARLDFFAGSIRQLAAVYAINPGLSEEAFVKYTYSTGIHANDDGIYSYGIFGRSASHGDDRYFLKLRQLGPKAPKIAAPLGTEIIDQPRLQLFSDAIDSGRPILATHILGLLDLSDSGQMMVSAVYSTVTVPATLEERRRKAIAIAYARFSHTGLFDQILQNAVSFKNSLDVQIFDGPIGSEQTETLFEHRSGQAGSFARSVTFEVSEGSRQFTIRVGSSHSQLFSTASFIALLILAMGVALSLVLFRVIRKREAGSERLLNSERQLKLVTESLPVLIAYIDRDYVYRFNNKGYEATFLRPRSEITGRKVSEIIGPSYPRVKQNLDRALRGERVEEDISIQHADGHEFLYHQVLLPDVNHHGEVQGIVAMLSNITDRIHSQERVKFLGDISRLLGSSLDPSVVADQLTKKLVSYCDWCVIELLNEEGEVDRHLYAASTPERYSRLEAFYKDYPVHTRSRRITQRARETRQTQFLPIVSSDTLHPVIPDPERYKRLLDLGFASIVVVPLMSGETLLGTMALYSGDKEHPYTNDDVQFFEGVAARSSIAFENARLYAQSQNLNRAKDHFLAMLSHELRTPMNVILGWLEILSTEDVDDETYEQAIDTLNRNAKVQIQLINDLLDVSRIINGKLSLNASKSNLGTIATGAIDSVQPAIRAKNIACEFKSEGDLSATLDPERIQQVLWNLLSNAVKFTPNGGRINVEVHGSRDDVRILVRDSGIGIDDAFLPFVFDRFRQEEGGFTRAQGGLGLGLSIVRYIIEGHGGTISVASEGRDKGSVFTVILPRIAQIQDDITTTDLLQ